MTHTEFVQSNSFQRDNQVFLRLALTATLYWSTDDAGPFGGVGPVLERFWPLIQTRARVYQTTSMKRPKKLDAPARSLVANIMAGGIEAGFGTLVIDDREGTDGAAANGIVLTAAPYRGVGYLVVKLAPEFPADQFANLLLDGTRSMAYLHGFAGFGLVYNDLGGLATAAERQLFAVGMRYPGLDLQSHSNSSFVARTGLKSVNWLTFVGDFLSANANLKFSEGAKGNLQIRRQSHGWVIQAGVAPCIGDVNRRNPCAAYAEVGRLLAPVRAKNHPAFILDEKLPIASSERTERWLSRFDT